MTDQSYSIEVTKNGTTNTTHRTITTHLKGSALGSARESLKGLAAKQTDKVQQIGVDTLTSQGATNIVQGIDQLRQIAIELEKLQSGTGGMLMPLK